MNIFVVEEDPVESAKALCDKHVVKMILESAQMLSTAHRILDGKKIITTEKNRKKTSYVLESTKRNDLLYRASHINHPCTIWCRESGANYNWLHKHLVALCEEYTARYHKIHKTQQIGLVDFLSQAPSNMKKIELTPFAQAMPEQYKSTNAVVAYRKYYINEKANIAQWNKIPSRRPAWFYK